MASLYNDLAPVYEAMYNTFIDYEEEFNYYSKILEINNCKSLVEIGCGTGQLAHRFLKNKFEYFGIDLSSEMLAICRKNNPEANFLQADMRLFNLTKKVAAAIMTGRTISYLITNNDVFNCFNSINQNLIKDGIFTFDCIDANKFIPIIKNGFDVTHKAAYGDKNYVRDSHWKVNFNQSWTFDWTSTYFEEKAGELINIGSDDSTIRAFTKDEIVTFLSICNFKIIDVQDRQSYAFDTFVVTAKK
jgi:predicted TPR repeat methyltransferase